MFHSLKLCLHDTQLSIVALHDTMHCVNSVRIRSYSGPIFPYSVRMRGNKDHNNSEYGHFLRSVEYIRGYLGHSQTYLVKFFAKQLTAKSSTKNYFGKNLCRCFAEY